MSDLLFKETFIAHDPKLVDLVGSFSTPAWLMGVDGQSNHFNAEWKRVAPVDSNLKDPDSPEWVHSLYPEDRRRIIADWLIAKSLNDAFELEFRLGSENTARWYSARVHPIREADGSIKAWLGICFDVHNKREHEQATERLLDRIPQMLFVSRSDGLGVYYNKRWLEYTGLSLEATTTPGVGWSVVHPDDLARSKAAWVAAIAAEKPFEFENRLRSVTGEYRWQLVRAVPVHDTNGVLTSWIGTCTDVHEQRLIEEQLQESRKYYQHLFDELPVMASVLDREGNLLFVNRAWYEITGYPTTTTFDLDAWREIIHPEDAASFMAEWQVALQEQRAFVGEVRLHHVLSNTYRWYLCRSVPIRGQDGEVYEWFGVAADVHEERMLRDELMESEAKAREIITSNIAGILIGRERYTVIDVNDTFLKIIGYSREEFENGKIPWTTISHPDDVEVNTYISEKLAKGERVLPIERRYVHKSGKTVYVMIAATSFNNGRNWAAFALDITALKEAERELIEAKDRALAASHAKDHFLAILSHELRTPLTPISLIADSLESDPDLPEYFLPQIKVIKRNIALEASIVDELLDLTRIERGKLELNKREFDLRDLLAQLVESMRHEAAEKEIRLTAKFPQQAVMIDADRSRLAQAFSNVIQNALKFTPVHGEVTVSLHGKEEIATIEIIDTGIGLSSDVIQRIFDPFEQGEKSVTRKYGGLGLGLSIAKNIIELHNGTISAANRENGSGAVFRISLAVEPLNGNALPKKRILLVQSGAAQEDLIDQLLKREYDVINASSYAHAARLLEDKRFDLILSDLDVDEEAGFQFIHSNASAKAIALSSRTNNEEIQRCKKAGFLTHFAKPFNVSTLLVVIDKLLS